MDANMAEITVKIITVLYFEIINSILNDVKLYSILIKKYIIKKNGEDEKERNLSERSERSQKKLEIYNLRRTGVSHGRRPQPSKLLFFLFLYNP